MDYEILTLFSVEEFTDLSHGMTARSTKSKRKAEPPTNHWGDTNQPHLDTEKRTPISAPDLDTRIRWANELRKTYYSN